MICIVKLAMLSFLPDGTKISFCEDKITFQLAGVYQGITRFAYGDKRDDIHNLLMPIYWACVWYSGRSDMKCIFNKAIVGIQKLKSIYKDNQVVFQCLHYYIIVIESHKNSNGSVDDDVGEHNDTSDSVNIETLSVGKVNGVKNEIDAFANDDMTKAYLCYQNLWSEEEISIICSLFNYLSSQNDKEKINILQSCIEQLLTIKSM